MQEIPVLGASQKLEFQKKRNSNFLNAEQPSSWSFSKIRVPKTSFHAKKQRAREANPKWHLRNQEQLFACRRVQRRWFKPVQPQGKMIKSTQKLESPQKVRVPKKKEL